MSRAKQKPRGMRQALEDALAAEPDELANHMAYADWLSEQGGEGDRARGEFVRAQLALENESLRTGERARLGRREAELLEAHQREWLGELAPFLLDGEVKPYVARGDGHERFPVFRHTRPPWLPEGEPWEGASVELPTFRFRRGWLHQLHVPHLSVYLSRALKRSPEGRLLGVLTVDEVQDYGSPPTDPEDNVPQGEHSVGLCPLVGSPYLSNVRHFRLGTDDGDDYRNYRCYIHSSVAADIVRQMPRVEELHLFANRYDLSDLLRSPTLSRLRVLQVYLQDQGHRLHLLAENPAAANLTHLLIHPHNVGAWWRSPQDDADGYNAREGFLPLSVVVPLLRSPNLPRLQHLRLRCSSMGDRGCREIVASGILKRLKSLDLRHGAVTDEGARTLAGCPDLRNLEWLDLGRNRLDADGTRRLRRLNIPLRVDAQQTRRERSPLPGNAPDYLYEGEFE